VLEDSVLNSSSEPCRMCLAACYRASVPRIVFAATSRDLVEYDFQDLAIYTELRLPAGHRSMREDADGEGLRQDALMAVRDWLSCADLLVSDVLNTRGYSGQRNGELRRLPMPKAQIKDEKTYRKLREKGESKEKSARIANAAAGSSKSAVGRKGGKSPSYADWSKQDLVSRAREIGIKGRSTMSKAELVKALRNH